ncbi:asparaginase [Patulibacter minatonensis]|uniref:asparaginase n=1 Tax=Patulibacter minatonensis TaxID=298163 RepID=UPI00047E4B12|nr:asparaginase [Patulibacter minatonensis]
MSRSRLGLVLTGGTIGSTNPGDADVVKLVRGPNAGGMPGWLGGPLAAFGAHQLSIERPVELHSEEARPADWEAIATSCRKLASRGVDAICILHGSDTMAYAAAALSFALADLDMPIVLTGSNLPPDAPESDARNNVRNALSALRMLPAGVYIVFGGDADGDALVHLGTRVRKERASGRAFVSPNGGAVAVVERGRLRRLVPWPLPQPLGPRPTAVSGANGTAPAVRSGAAMGFTSHPAVARFDPRVLELRVHPGLPVAALEAAVDAGGLRGLVVELYPCATGPTGTDDSSLSRLAEHVTARGGVVVGTVAAAPDTAGSYYPSLPTLTASGIGFLPGVLTSTATVKLMWALEVTGGDPARTRALMRRTVAGEVALVGRPAPRRGALNRT